MKAVASLSRTQRPASVLFGVVLVAATSGYLGVSAVASTRSLGNRGLIAFDFAAGSQRSRSPLFKPGNFDLVKVDGSGLRTISNAREPTWSPSGKQVAFVCGSDICSSNVDGSGRRQLTHAPSRGIAYGPAWSPDRRLIAYSCLLGSDSALGHVCAVNAVGGGTKTLSLAPGSPVGTPLMWSPDSKRLLVSAGRDSYVITVASGSSKQTTFLTQRFAGDDLRVEGWTPDNRIVFSIRTPTHDPAFRGNAVVRLYSVLPDGSGQRPLPANVPVRSPQWSPDGQEFLGRTARPPNLRGVPQLWTVARNGRYLRKVVELPPGYDFVVFAWQP